MGRPLRVGFLPSFLLDTALFKAAALLSSESDWVPLDRVRFRGGESWTGEEARLEDRLVVLAIGFAGLAGAGFAAPLVVARGAALAGAVPAGPREVALVDRRRGGWLDMVRWSSNNTGLLCTT